jgi:hypothetical protein
VEFIDDGAFENLTPEELRKRVPADYRHGFMMVVDETAVKSAEHPLLVLDLLEGRALRAVATSDSRSRRIETLGDGSVWYVDEPRGYLGRIDPATGNVREWLMPGGEGSMPYALTKDDRDRIWFSETGPAKQLVGFDPGSEEFFSVNEVSHNIRHMMFDEETGAMWFGTDANNVGRILARAVTQ